MASLVSAEFFYLFVPSIVYWLYSGFYALFGEMKKYRLHPKEDEERKNIPSRRDVVKLILIQQSVAISFSILVFLLFQGDAPVPEPSIPVRLIQIFLAMVIMDTYGYFAHRYLHTNKFLYKHVHSMHHSVTVPYAYAALYTHPFEWVFQDLVGSVLAAVITDMTPLTAMLFYSFGQLKTVDDHCGFMLPFHPLRLLLENNSAYHDVHHQLVGNKYNFSQPFFVTWDKIMGTYMPFTLEKREDRGIDARPIIKKQD